MIPSPLPRLTAGARGLTRSVDAAVGAAVERLVVERHRRRLGRLGLEAVLDAPAGGWASSGWAARSSNRLEVFVDGVDALSEIAAAIEAAQSSVWLAGWYFSPEFRLRPNCEQTLSELLAEVSTRIDVRLLAWAGSPLPLFKPDRGQVGTVAGDFRRQTRVRVALDARERPLHCHHEKLVIVDNQQAFVGGIDLTSYAGDRLDSSEHSPRGSLGWHDAATRIRGPAVADVAEHFRLRWQEVTGERLPDSPPPEPAGEVELQIVRTVPERIYRRCPRGEFTILESYLRALRSARRLVYLENQFLWSPEIVAVLADKLRNPPSDHYRLLVLLPTKPNNGNEDTRGQLGVLAQADGGAGRFLACTLYQRGEDACPVYVHAKIGIIDDAWLTVGSANLNEHSLLNDTEMNIVTHDPDIARQTRIRLWAEHLELPATELARDPADVIDTEWKPRAEQQLDRRRNHQPPTHRLARLPHVSRRSEALRGPLNSMLVDT